jgi:predicted phage terminase large subunit-like protein
VRRLAFAVVLVLAMMPRLAAFAETVSASSRGERWLAWAVHRYLAAEIMRAVAEPDGRLIINLPPRIGKSLLSSKWLPAFFLNTFPERFVGLASYEASFAAEWGRRVRDIFEAQPLWTKIRPDKREAKAWETIDGGGMFTAGAGGPLLGKGFHLGILDDPYKNWREAHSPTIRRHIEEWFSSTFMSRAEPGASVIIVHQRWHTDDLTGYLEREYPGEWKVITLPALAGPNDPMGRAEGESVCPGRYPAERFEKIKATTPIPIWEAVYQQRPLASLGSIIKAEWFTRFYDSYSNLPDFKRQAQSWDFAVKGKTTGSKSCGNVWGEDKAGADLYLLDLVYEHMDFTAELAAIRGMTARWPEATLKLIEDKANGPAIMNKLRGEIAGFLPWEPSGDKTARLYSAEPRCRAGNIVLPSRRLCPWVGDWLAEICSAPNCDDWGQADTFSQYVEYVEKGTSTGLSGRMVAPMGIGTKAGW